MESELASEKLNELVVDFHHQDQARNQFFVHRINTERGLDRLHTRFNVKDETFFVWFETRVWFLAQVMLKSLLNPTIALYEEFFLYLFVATKITTAMTMINTMHIMITPPPLIFFLHANFDFGSALLPLGLPWFLDFAMTRQFISRNSICHKHKCPALKMQTCKYHSRCALQN